MVEPDKPPDVRVMDTTTAVDATSPEDERASKRKRIGSASDIVTNIHLSPVPHPTDDDAASLSANMYAQVNENIIPVIDSASSVCSNCQTRALQIHTLACAKCNRRFHAYCDQLMTSDVVNKKVLMPSRTAIEGYVTKIVKTGDDYIGGRFDWTCASCLNVTESSKVMNTSDRLNRLEAILLRNNAAYDSQFDKLQLTIATLQKQVTDLISLKSVPDVGDKSVIVAPSHEIPPKALEKPPSRSASDAPLLYSEVLTSDTNNSCVPGSSVTAPVSVMSQPNQRGLSSKSTVPEPSYTPEVSHQNSSIKTRAKFSLRVSKNDDNGSTMMKVLEKLAIDGKIDSYDFRSRGKFAVDLLFSASKDAVKAHSRLSDADENSIVIGSIEMVCPKKVYFVGLPEGVGSKGLLSLLLERYPLLSIDSCNEHSIKIFAPRRCTKDKDQIRSTVFLSDELYNFFMNTLSGRVPIGFYTILNVYDCVMRCIKCQGLGHTVESCNKRGSVCGHCGGNHHTRRCSFKDKSEFADKLFCVNCHSSAQFRDQCKGHGAIDAKCPFYLNYIKEKDKG